MNGRFDPDEETIQRSWEEVAGEPLSDECMKTLTESMRVWENGCLGNGRGFEVVWEPNDDDSDVIVEVRGPDEE